MSDELQSRINAIGAEYPIGVASAVKRGQFADRPYIAIINDYLGKKGATHNPMGKRAYATRDEAIAAVSCYIEGVRVELIRKLNDPRYRALREQYGLPKELV